MPSILIIADHRLRRSPSQRYRFEQYLDFFKANGYHWELSEIISKKDDAVFYKPGNYFKKAIIVLKSFIIRIKDVYRAKQFDIVFIQREALLIGSSFFEKQFYKITKTIFDFDDSIWLLDTSPENKKFEFLKNPNKTKTNITRAHAVIAGNSFLATYAKQFNKHTFIIPTTIDCSIHQPKKNTLLDSARTDKKIVIGWSGSISTIKHFEIIIPILVKLQKKYPHKIEIHVIGQTAYTHPTIDVVSKAWSEDMEVTNLNCFDIGIMPLPDDEWVKGKCGLKGLSYMACGVATVMSKVGVNSEIIEHGINGFLVSTEQEWMDILSNLIENEPLRLAIATKGRETVVQHYSVEANKDKYLEIFDSLLNTDAG